MANKPIQAFRLQTRLEVDGTQHAAQFKKAEGEVKKYGEQVVKTGKEATNAFKGAEVGKKWGSEFGASAVSSITGSIQSLGQTLGAVIGTAIAPGIGTAIGSTLGSGIDTALQKISGPIIQTITQGIELNKEIEKATVHFTAFGGSEIEAAKHLKELKELSLSSGLDLRDVIQGSERLEEFSGKLGDTSLKLKAAAAASIVFGHGAEGFNAVANALGLMTEKGELTVLMLRKLERAEGVPATKYLAQAFGYTEQKMTALIKAGRIRGDVAAQIIAESTIRDKGPRAAAIMQGTTYGAEQRFGVLTAARAQEGTLAATAGLKDFYTQADAVLDSPQAKELVDFLNQTAGGVINWVKKGLKSGISLGAGIAQGMSSGETLQALRGAGESILGSLEGFFQIKSPSELTAVRLGEPMGEGAGIGMVRRFSGFMAGKGAEEIRAALDELVKDPRIAAFFAAIERAEGGAPNRIVGGKTVSDLSRHPNIVGLRTAKGPSTAFGSYQITGSNWYGTAGHPGLQQRLGLPDASAHSQLLAAALMFADRDGGAGIRALLAGDLDTALKIGGKDWTSTPGSKIGGGGQKSVGQWMGYYSAALAGKPIDRGNPMPVIVVADIQGGAAQLVNQDRAMKSLFVGAGENWKRGGAAGPAAAMVTLNPELPKLGENITSVTEQVRDLTGAFAGATPAVQGARVALATIGVGLPPLMKGVNDVAGNLAKGAVGADAMIGKSAAEIRLAGQITLSMADQLVGAFQQISGMIPGQATVGKKRGFFSKLLGFAAPFLAFIPGVGPILSTIAGAASNIAGGNYGAAVSSIAGGFATGGVFQGGAGTAPKPAKGSAGRASGGPVRFGSSYRVGERGAEWFVPDQNGQIIPNGAGGLHSLLERHGALLDRVARSLDRLDAVPYDHVVAKGARGLMSAMDSNAGISEQMGRRLRLG